MLNPHKLNPEFVTALNKSWDRRAIWPGCEKDFVPGVSADCFGQCLVATLCAWHAQGASPNGWSIIPGIARGPGLSAEGIWHFHLAHTNGKTGEETFVDTTSHQFESGVAFCKIDPSDNFALYEKIISRSLWDDTTLEKRLGIIANNLAFNGFNLHASPAAIIRHAQTDLEANLAEGAPLWSAPAPDQLRLGRILRYCGFFPYP